MKGRFGALAVVSGLAIVWWIGYLFCVQVLDLHDLGGVRLTRYNPANRILIPKRGDIRDRNGNLLVSTIRYHQVDIERQRIRDWCKEENRDVNETFRTVADILAKHTPLTVNQALAKLRHQSPARSVKISDRVRDDDLAALRADMKAAGIPGLISTFGSMRRTYSHGLLAARLLGAVTEHQADADEEDFYRLEGLCGLEATFNTELTGTYGWKKVYYDATNESIPHPDLKEKPRHDGSTVELTLDMNMQEILENKLRVGLEEYSASNAMGIIMNPHTGEILALAGIGAQDSVLSPGTVRSMPNLPVSFLFEPGSIFKPFTALLALEKGLYQPNDIINCRTYNTGRRVIHDAHEFGDLTFREVVSHSSNTGMAHIAEKVGERAMYDRFVAMGFGHTSGSGLYGEKQGVLRDLKHWSSFSLHSLSFGQEISVTAMQMANAYCALANGGKLMEPHIVSRVLNDNGQVVRTWEPRVLRTVSNPAALDTLKTFLYDAVEGGTSTATRLGYISVAGKTGTAEKSAAGSHGYAAHLYTSSFCGFLPVEDPQLVMVIVFDEADYAHHYASMSAVPTFREVAEGILILPDCRIMTSLAEEKSDPVTMPDVQGLARAEAMAKLQELNIVVQCNGETGSITAQYPKPGVTFDRRNRVLLVAGTPSASNEPTADRMPDLTGMSLRRALQTARQCSLDLRVEGQGVVVAQSIPPGTAVKPAQVCRVEAR